MKRLTVCPMRRFNNLNVVGFGEEFSVENIQRSEARNAFANFGLPTPGRRCADASSGKLPDLSGVAVTNVTDLAHNEIKRSPL
jgi:hypothetical protein